MNWLKNSWSKILDYLRKVQGALLPDHSSTPPAVTATPSEPTSKKKPRVKLKEKHKDAVFLGQYVSAKELLDDAHSILGSLDSVRLHPTTRNFLKHYGASMVSAEGSINIQERETPIEECPAFLCVAWPPTENSTMEGFFRILFSIVIKTDIRDAAPANQILFRNFKGDIYDLSIVYFDPSSSNKKHNSSMTTCFVGVTPDKKVVPLKMHQTRRVYLPNGNYYMQQYFDYPAVMRSLYADHLEIKRRDDTKEWYAETVEQYIRETFYICYNSAMRREWGINVTCSSKHSRVVAVIPDDTAKHLFKDRIKVKTKNGFTRKIFHSVTAHTRKTGANVRTHYRGLKRFTWNKMKVVIGIPGKDFIPLYTFGVSSTTLKEGQEGYSLGKIGELLDQTNQSHEVPKGDVVGNAADIAEMQKDYFDQPETEIRL